MKKMMKHIILLLCFIILMLFFINIVEAATKPKGSMSIVEFGKKGFETLNRISESDALYKKVRLIRPIILSKS
jgi:hypothetical protein